MSWNSLLLSYKLCHIIKKMLMWKPIKCKWDSEEIGLSPRFGFVCVNPNLQWPAAQLVYRIDKTCDVVSAKPRTLDVCMYLSMELELRADKGPRATGQQPTTRAFFLSFWYTVF
jgi:hypothetical protein